jgi:type I restriction-modification system DNA methylase subunit
MSAQNPAGLHALVNELGKRLTLGESFDNRQLRELSNQFLGGTRGQGVWTPRDAYDALETAVNKFLFDTMAAELIKTESEALDKLSGLLKRLPTQSDRTEEQNELQQFSTPPTLALIAAKLLDAKSGDTVLEPSAGTGSLAVWAQALVRASYATKSIPDAVNCSGQSLALRHTPSTRKSLTTLFLSRFAPMPC